MKLEPVKKYNKPKYPNEEEVKENKELLLQPLDKWKKMGITSAMLIALLTKLETKCAAQTSADIMNGIGIDGVVELAGDIAAPIEHVVTNEILGNSTKKVVQNYSIVNQLTEYNKNITTSEFGKIIEAFFDWLLVQGIM